MSQEYQKFHLALMGVATAHKKYSMSKFSGLNLTTGQPKVLSVLLQQEGYLQKDLAKRCHVEPATMTSILKNMELKGLIRKQRVSVSGGKKAYSIYLTEEGRDRACRVKTVVDDAEEICFDGFNQEDKLKFIEMMLKLQNNLEKQIVKE